MNTAIGYLVIVAALLTAQSALAQLVVPSYEREQPFLFCDGIPQGEELSVPFDLINRGTLPITIDSAIAAGDTADFYANYLVGSPVTYLNPVMWKYINDKVLAPGDIVFNSFFFTPKTPGPKNLMITVYYHDSTGSHTTQATMMFHTSNAPAGLSFLSSVTDTIAYADSIGFTSVTYDRSVVGDSVVITDTLRVGDTLRAVLLGEGRLDLSACGDATITAVQTTQSVPSDLFQVLSPGALPRQLGSGDSTLVDFIYVVRSPEEPTRAAEAVFTSTAGTVRLKLQLFIDFSSGVEEEEEEEGDERGGVAVSETGLTSAPNPFSSVTTLRLATPRSAHARLSVLDAVGREIEVLLDGTIEAGVREIPFRSAGLAPGVYFARMVIDGQARVHRLMVVR